MANPAITIVGGGLGGLTLGRILLHRGIPVVIYDRNTSPPRYNYGITLSPWAYQPLCLALGGVSENAFRNLVAVDKASASSTAAVEAGNKGRASFRANRGDLENWLRQDSSTGGKSQSGLDMRWGHELQQIDLRDDGIPSLRFENGNTIQSNIIIAADGVHSNSRKSLLPESQPNILPFVVFNGKRKIDSTLWTNEIQIHMNGSSVQEFKHGETRLAFSINRHETSNVCVSWTFSRPSHGTHDALHKPNRALSEATTVPEDLYNELQNFSQSTLPPALQTLLDPAHVRNDRILHWLMRTTIVPQENLGALAQKGIVFIGDAVHAHPILGGNGANMAISDALSLADEIVALRDAPSCDFQPWVEGRCQEWVRSVQLATESIESLHAC